MTAPTPTSTDNAAIATAVDELLTILDQRIPDTTIDYRVEEARRALTSLKDAAAANKLITRDVKAARDTATH